MTQGVRALLAVVIALVATALGYLVLRAWLAHGSSLVEVSWVSAALFGLMALVVAGLGWDIRRYTRGRPRSRVLTPQHARSVLVGAQASILAGSAFVGWYAAHCLHLHDLWDIPTQRALFWRYAITALGALLLVLAGFFTQWACRVDPPEDEDDLPRGLTPAA